MNKMFKTIVFAVATFVGVSSHAGSCPEKADIVDTAVSAGQFNTLAAALTAADLVTTLKSEGPFTVFAPVDAAFEKLPAGTVDSLLGDIPALKNILLYHVAAGEFSPRSLLGMGQINTVQGKEVMIEKRDGKIFVNDSEVLGVVRASNGIIYVIDTVLLP